MLANIINLLTFLCWLLSSIWLHGFTSTCTILVFILFFTILVKKIFPDNIYEIITLVIIGLIGVSWLLAGFNLLIFFLTSSFTYMILIKKEIIMKKPIFGKAKISAKSLDYSIAFFILTLIAFNGVKTNDITILARVCLLAFNSRKTKLRRAFLWVAVSRSKSARGRPHVAPNLHYDSASACPLSLNSKEIKCTKARNTRQRAPTRRPDTTCNQSHSRRYARGHQAPLNPLAPSRRSSSTASRCAT